MSLNLLPPPHGPDCSPCFPCTQDRRALGHLPPAEVRRQREGAMKTGWTLGPAHPLYGAPIGPAPQPYQRQDPPRPRSTWAKPSGFRCSQCGAQKPAARSHCPCGAFQKTTSSTGKVASGSSAAPHSARLGILCVRPEAATPDPRTVNVVSTEVADLEGWRYELRRLSYRRQGTAPSYFAGTRTEKVRQVAATAELWGLPVGIVTGVREEMVR